MHGEAAGMRLLNDQGQRVEAVRSVPQLLPARLPGRVVECVRPASDLHQDGVEPGVRDLLHHGLDTIRAFQLRAHHPGDEV